MNDDFGRVFYLVPLHHKGKETTLLTFPSDLSEVSQSEDVSTLGYGIFAFVRHERNRGNLRVLSFPAISGFGEAAQQTQVTLRSDYYWTRNSNRFVADELPGRIAFAARKFSPNFQLAGNAKRLANFSLWALIPENREELEAIWRERGFYLLGYGE